MDSPHILTFHYRKGISMLSFSSSPPLICGKPWSRTTKASQEKALQEQSEARKEKARLAKEKKLQLLSRWLGGRDHLRCQCGCFQKWMIYNYGKPYQDGWFGGPTPIFGNTHVQSLNVFNIFRKYWSSLWESVSQVLSWDEHLDLSPSNSRPWGWHLDLYGLCA